MATYGKSEEVRKMGLGGLVVRTAAAGLIGWGALTGGGWVLNRINGNDAVVEQGYVNPKSLDIQDKKNAAGNIETYLQHKRGDKTDFLPCTEGYSGGVVCGTIDYILKNLSPEQREGVVVKQWPEVSNDSKHEIMSAELQKVLDAFYGMQKSQQPQQQYDTTRK